MEYTRPTSRWLVYDVKYLAYSLPVCFLLVLQHCFRLVRPNEVYIILSGPSMKYGRPEAYASLSQSGCILRQYLILWENTVNPNPV